MCQVILTIYQVVVIMGIMNALLKSKLESDSLLQKKKGDFRIAFKVIDTIHDRNS